LESLAEKKKKAAEFMNLEKEGASIHKDHPSEVTGGVTGRSGSVENPERDAAVDALLATFGSVKEEPPADTMGGEENSATEFTSGAPSGSPGVSEAQQSKHEQYKYEDALARPVSRGERRPPRRSLDYGTRPEEYEKYRDGHESSRNLSLPDARQEPRSDIRKPDYDERDRRQRSDPRYRYDRYEDAEYPKEPKPLSGPDSASGRKPVDDGRYPPAGDERRDPRANDYYRGPEVSRVDHPNDPYTMRPSRYPVESPLQDPDYNTVTRDYPPYPPPGRYVPREDPRYPQTVPRPPEADYAALYYRDLNEWLEITGYHDYAYRQATLSRHREPRAPEGSGRYLLEHEPAYVPRTTRDEPDPRRPALYSMPPPHVPAPWDERDAAKRGISTGGPRLGYTLPHEERGFRDELPPANSVGLKRRPTREDEFSELPHSAKSARHSYDSHRKPMPYGSDNGLMQRTMHGEDSIDETEAVRLALSQRVASARGRDASPGATGDRSRRRSMSPRPYVGHKRDYSQGHKSPGPSSRFEGRGRGDSRFPPKDDFRKPFRARRNSFGESPNNYERKPFGRERGRGYSKDNYERHDGYDRRSNMDDPMEMNRIPGVPGGEPHSHIGSN
jgi:hypothetical protein